MATNAEKLKALKKRKVRPMGPGELAAGIFEEAGISHVEAAKGMGVSRVHLNRFLNGHVGLSSEMANRLGLFLGNGAAFWMRVQHEREMWDLLHCDPADYAEVEPLRVAA